MTLIMGSFAVLVLVSESCMILKGLRLQESNFSLFQWIRHFEAVTAWMHQVKAIYEGQYGADAGHPWGPRKPCRREKWWEGRSTRGNSAEAGRKQRDAELLPQAAETLYCQDSCHGGWQGTGPPGQGLLPLKVRDQTVAWGCVWLVVITNTIVWFS